MAHEFRMSPLAARHGIIPVVGVDPYAGKGYDNPPNNVCFYTCKAIKEREG
jgi:phytanoyl-CoA hydroxylase